MRAALGQREEDDGTTCPIAPEQARTARRQAAWITAVAGLVAVAGAVAVWLAARLV